MRDSYNQGKWYIHIIMQRKKIVIEQRKDGIDQKTHYVKGKFNKCSDLTDNIIIIKLRYHP